MSLLLGPVFLVHLYVQLEILQSDEKQSSSCHIFTIFAHSTILQHLLWECCARHLAKCRCVRFAMVKSCSCPKVITDFCDSFMSDFQSTYYRVGLKMFGVEFFDKGVGFCWRAYRYLGPGYTCVDSVMGFFVDVVRTNTLLTAFDERGITYLIATMLGSCLISPMRGFGLCTILLIE